MRIKYFFITLLIILIILSISQVISIPPYSDDIFKVYKSGYFDEIEKEFEIIKDSFIGIKTLSKPVYGWIFLSDIEKRYKIDINVYDLKGRIVKAPGKRDGMGSDMVLKVLNSDGNNTLSEIRFGKFYSVMPILSRKECKFCHRGTSNAEKIGAISFERDYDGHIYYSAERMIIFILITIVLSIMLFFIYKWDPEKKIKEMFDNF